MRFSKFGVNASWEEEPSEGVPPPRFGVVRRYQSGPVSEMRVAAELHEQDRVHTYGSFYIADLAT